MPRTLDQLLGNGVATAIGQIIARQGRVYAVDFVRDHAETLLNAQLTQLETRGLLAAFCNNVATTAQFDDVVALAAALRAAGWKADILGKCAGDFITNANGQTGAQWGAIGALMGADKRAETKRVAQMVGWNPGSVLALAQAIANDNPNRSSAEWYCNLGATLGANSAAATAAFMALQGWAYHVIGQLVQNFQAVNPHNYTGEQWAALARRVGVDAVNDATAFARLANWNQFDDLLELAKGFKAYNTNALTATEYLAVATAAGAHNHANAVKFCRSKSANNTKWTGAKLVTVVTAFVAGNPNNYNAAAWTDFAAELPADADDDVIAFARVTATGAAGWKYLDAITLTKAYAASNANNFTGAQWCAIAAELPANAHASVTAFARVRGRQNAAWTAGPAAQLAAAFRTNAGNFSADNWVAIAAVLRADEHANTATFARAGWSHGDTVSLATLFGTDPKGQTAATWVTLANRAGRNNWAADTQQAAKVRGQGWPDQVAIRTVQNGGTTNWSLEGANDGLVYRVTNQRDPHITIHNLGDDSPDAWWGHGGESHVITAGERPWDYYKRAAALFRRRGEQARQIPDEVPEIIDSFCTALNH